MTSPRSVTCLDRITLIRCYPKVSGRNPLYFSKVSFEFSVFVSIIIWILLICWLQRIEYQRINNGDKPSTVYKSDYFTGFGMKPEDIWGHRIGFLKIIAKHQIFKRNPFRSKTFFFIFMHLVLLVQLKKSLW